jgi:thiol peroxidase
VLQGEENSALRQDRKPCVAGPSGPVPLSQITGPEGPATRTQITPQPRKKGGFMARITLKGSTTTTCGTLPVTGSKAPDFTLTKADLSDVSLRLFAGKKIVLNIFPSIDTSVCAMSVRRFNAEAGKLDTTIVLCISADLPFSATRFCGAEGLRNVVTLSTFRHPEFGDAYGVRIVDGGMAGLMSRAIVVIDEKGSVIYTEQVPEIAQEPDYAAALKAIG